MSALIVAASLSACAPSPESSSGSHVHTESEHSHDHTQNDDKTQNNPSKKPSNKNENNTSSKVSVGIQRPIASGKDKNVDYNKYAELPEYSKTISDRLFSDLENKDHIVMYFYNVKSTTFGSTSYVDFDVLEGKLGHHKDVRDVQEISDFKIALSLHTWTPKKFTARTTPSVVIYFDKDLHLNLEGKVDGAYWLSLNASYGKVYYIVPESVHKYIETYSR